MKDKKGTLLFRGAFFIASDFLFGKLLAMKELQALTVTGYLEGMSFLLLLCVAMPLRMYFDISEPVRYVGMAHGILFIAYIVILMSTASKVRMPLWAMPGGVLSALLPFGPFVFDRLLKNSVQVKAV